MFDNLKIGNGYTQIELAELWGYKSYHGIRRGIVTPKGKNIIVLFITGDKVSYATQYNDCLIKDILTIQGETKHGNDKRLLNNLNSLEDDDIQLFYREKHHEPFVYKGKVMLVEAEIHESQLSQFKFKLLNY